MPWAPGQTLQQTLDFILAVRLGERYIDHVVYSMLAADWPAGKYGFPP